MASQRVVVVERVAYDIYKVRACGERGLEAESREIFAPHDPVIPLFYSYEFVEHSNRLVDPQPTECHPEIHQCFRGEGVYNERDLRQTNVDHGTCTFGKDAPGCVKRKLHQTQKTLWRAIPLSKYVLPNRLRRETFETWPRTPCAGVEAGLLDWRSLVREIGGPLRLPALWRAMAFERQQIAVGTDGGQELPLKRQDVIGRVETAHKDILCEAALLEHIMRLMQAHRRVWLSAEACAPIASVQYHTAMSDLIAAGVIRTRRVGDSVVPEIALEWAAEQVDVFLAGVSGSPLQVHCISQDFLELDSYRIAPLEVFRRIGLVEFAGPDHCAVQTTKRARQSTLGTESVLVVSTELAVDDWIERRLVTISMILEELPPGIVLREPLPSRISPLHWNRGPLVRLHAPSEQAAIRHLRSGEFRSHMDRTLVISSAGHAAIEHAANRRLVGAWHNNGLPEHCYRVRFTTRVRLSQGCTFAINDIVDIVCVSVGGSVKEYAVVYPIEYAHVRVPADVIHTHTVPANRVSYRGTLHIPRGGYSAVVFMQQTGAGKRWLLEAARIANGAPLYIISI